MTDDDIAKLESEVSRTGCFWSTPDDEVLTELKRGREAIRLLHDMVSECSSLALQWEAEATCFWSARLRDVTGKHADTLRAAIKRVLAKQRGMVGGDGDE